MFVLLHRAARTRCCPCWRRVWLWVSGGATTAAIRLFVWTLVVGTLDNLLRPVLIRRGADLPLLLIMAGVIGGLLSMGSSGCSSAPWCWR